jgi:hypothetical protein
MQNNDDLKKQDEIDQLRAAAILRKRCDEITTADRAFLAAGIAAWKAENDAR